MPRIGVNALYLIPGGVGGTEIYLRNLLAALSRIDRDNQYFIYTNRETGRDLVPAVHNFHHRPQALNAEFRPARLFWEQTVLPWNLRKDSLDVLLNPGFTAPFFAPCRTVTVFHDLQHKRLPEHFRWFDRPFWNFFLWLAVRRSSALIAVSESTRRDLERFYSRDAAVIHHGVDPEFKRIADVRQPEGFLLCVSTLHPHKNLERLLRVHRHAPQLPPLILTGLKGFAAKRIQALATERVHITGWIPRHQLYDLFRRAQAFVYPSTFEGFGMPVLEAMAAGVPVACSAIAPLQEVAGNTVLYFDPLNDVALLDALERLSNGNRSVEPARQRAAQFSWERCAQETLTLLLAQI